MKEECQEELLKKITIVDNSRKSPLKQPFVPRGGAGEVAIQTDASIDEHMQFIDNFDLMSGAIDFGHGSGGLPNPGQILVAKHF